MPAESEHWNELKEFEHCAPSAIAFRALVALLETWPGDDQAAAIEFADVILSKWPDGDRIAPWSWCKAASKGESPSSWKLVRSLQLKPGHLSKENLNLALLATRAELEHITELELPGYSQFQELSYLCHRPEQFPNLKKLRAKDKYDDADVRALADSPLWQTLESFDVEPLTESLAHKHDVSRIVPRLDDPGRLRHLSLRGFDLMALWDQYDIPNLQSASVFIRTPSEAQALAKRAELSQLTSLSIAFRCGFSGSSPFEPYQGTIIEPDEAAADAFFRRAELDRLETLGLFGYSMAYWGREGLGIYGLEALIASGLLQRLKHLRLELLPLGDEGVAALSPALGAQLETLELVDVYCKGDGARALSESSCLSSLKHLDLSANRIDSDGIVRLAHADIPNLEFLDLSGPGVNPYYWNVGQQPVLDAGAVAWAESSNAEHLKTLRLANCFLHDDSLKAIFGSSKLQSLSKLDLSHNYFTKDAISSTVVDSTLWQTLEQLSLNDCRLGNGEVEALTRVNEAPKLRELELAYNSIGPGGAAALAKWPALQDVWILGLHDNVLGDEGLIALTESPFLRRLVELDLEQDCWNSRAFDFQDESAEAFAKSDAFFRLDALFSGCVDEYHGTAYSPGFTKKGLNLMRNADGMRPAFLASLSDFTGISEYYESGEFDDAKKLDEHDFRGHPLELNEREAEGSGQRKMQQLRSPSATEEPDVDPEPPKVSPLNLDFEESEEDIIEGLQFLDPIPQTDLSDDLTLALEHEDRALPQQAGKFLSDTLSSIFKACAIGSFSMGGSSSRKGEDGEYHVTGYRFYVHIKGTPDTLVQLIRETLWWIGAPETCSFRELSLDLTTAPESMACSFLQLSNLKITRYGKGKNASHRIDRPAFSSDQRTTVRDILDDCSVEEIDDGWTGINTSDGGTLRVFDKYLDDDDKFAALDILIENMKPGVSELVYRLMHEGNLLLLPMAFAATDEAAASVDCDWPEVKLIASPAELHELLAHGPYFWWKHR